jgi:hypothetical protein
MKDSAREAALRVRELSYRYPGSLAPVLHGLDFEIREKAALCLGGIALLARIHATRAS